MRPRFPDARHSSTIPAFSTRHKFAAQWVKMHVAYRGIVSALNDCTYPFYIASSKSAPRAAALLRGLLGQPIPVDSPRLYAGLIPPGERKTQALQEIISRPIVAVRALGRDLSLRRERGARTTGP